MGRPSKYPSEFCDEAIALVIEAGRSRAEVARSLGISENTLRNWVSARCDQAAREAGPDGLSESERDELKRLRKENIDLRTDREILRKAAAYFAGETTR